MTRATRERIAVPNSPAPASTTAPPPGNEKTPAVTTKKLSPRFREARPDEYGKSFVIGAALPPKQR
jgi:hypothetical protein